MLFCFRQWESIGKWHAWNLWVFTVHDVSVSTMMLTFFDTVQAISNFFSSSTFPWQQLMRVTNI